MVAGDSLLAAPGIEGRLRCHGARALQALGHGSPVVFVIEVVEEDRRVLPGVSRLQPDPATAPGAHEAHREHETRVHAGVLAAGVAGHGVELVLQVAVVCGPGTREEAARFGEGRGPGAALCDEPLQSRCQAPPAGEAMRDRKRLLLPIAHLHDEVILEIAPHVRDVRDERDAVLGKVRRIADARQEQDLRRVDGTA